MSWKAVLLLVADFPARPLQELTAERVGPVTGFVAAAAWVAGLSSLLIWRLPLVEQIRWGPLGGRELGLGLACGLVLFVLGAVGYVAAERLLEIEGGGSRAFAGSLGGAEAVIVAVATTAAATAEEAVFRGVVLEALGEAGSTLLVVLGSATLFAVYHLSAYQLLSTWLYGVVLAGVTLWTGGLWTAVVAHVTLNLAGLGMAALTAGTGATGA